MNPEVINFALIEGQENIKTHIESLAVLRSESNTTISFLIAGSGAALGCGIKVLEGSGDKAVLFGLFSVCFYLCLLSGLLLWKCLWIDDMMPAHCEPKNLYHPQFDILSIKVEELGQLQIRCEFNRERTCIVGWWLNCTRVGIFATPVIFLLVWVAS